jgi:hypothetical protein
LACNTTTHRAIYVFHSRVLDPPPIEPVLTNKSGLSNVVLGVIIGMAVLLLLLLGLVIYVRRKYMYVLVDGLMMLSIL